jgi:hypothetical protein
MVATHVLAILSESEVGNRHGAVYMGIVLAAWYCPSLLVQQLARAIGPRIAYLLGSIILTVALFFNADISTKTIQLFWPPVFIGLGMCFLSQSVILLRPCQPDTTNGFLRLTQWSSCIIGALIGGPCTYYLSLVTSTVITFRVMSGIMQLCFLVILRVIHQYNSALLKNTGMFPRNYGTLFVYGMSSLACGAAAWAPIFCTYLVALIKHDAGGEYSTWQLTTACMMANLGVAALLPSCTENTKGGTRLTPVLSLLVGLSIWGFTLTNSHAHHIWISVVSGAASAGLRIHFVSWSFFFQENTEDWSVGIGDLMFGLGSLLGVGGMTLSGMTNSYLHWMIVVCAVAGTFSFLLSLQDKEKFADFYQSHVERSTSSSAILYRRTSNHTTDTASISIDTDDGSGSIDVEPLPRDT